MYARTGQVGRGPETLDGALAWVERPGVTTMEAEAHRLFKERTAPQDASHAEAHQMLARICDWFDEGFDTPDLRDTRELLDEMDRAESGQLPALKP